MPRTGQSGQQRREELYRKYGNGQDFEAHGGKVEPIDIPLVGRIGVATGRMPMFRGYPSGDVVKASQEQIARERDDYRAERENFRQSLADIRTDVQRDVAEGKRSGDMTRKGPAGRARATAWGSLEAQQKQRRARIER